MTRRRRPALLFLALTCLSQAGFAESVSWQGRYVVDLVDYFGQQGFQIIYSSDTLTDDLIIADEPDSVDSLDDLAAVLQPHGLALVDGPAGRWLVVRNDAQDSSSQAAVAQATVVPLPEIVVTSSLHKLHYLRGVSHTELDRELTVRTPAATEEAVRITNRVPGTASGGISARNHIRGGEANEVLFLLDGLRLYEPYHLRDFQSVATIINSNAIDGIDFYTGAYPAKYGDRMSGVMNMSLRTPGKPIETELSLSFFNTSALSLGTFGSDEQGDWLFAARRGNLDLIADVVDPDVGSPDYQDYLLHAGWEFGPRTQLSANLLYSKDKLTLADVDRGEFANADYENQVLWLKWRADWSDVVQSETILSISEITNRRTGALDLPGIVSGNLDETRDFDAFGFRQDWKIAASPTWMLEFGVDAKHQDANYQFDSEKLVSMPFDQILDNVALESRRFILSPESTQYGAYVQTRWLLHPNLILDTGIRWDNQRFTTSANDGQSSPRLSLLYRLDERTELRFGWGRFAQAQEINELQVSDGIGLFFPAQRAEHIVANLKRNLGSDMELVLSYYQKNFGSVRPRFENAFNTLTLLPEIQFDRYRIDPLAAQAYGAELTLSKGDAEQDIFWWLGYAWSEVRDETATEKILRSWDQTHTVKAGISWRWGRWDFSAAGEVHTGWPKTELIAGSTLNPDGTVSLTLATSAANTARHSVFHNLDTRVSREFKVRRGELTAFLDVTNFYDRQNPCCTDISVNAAVNGGQTLTQKEANWLPLVPSLGVIWRF